jgi:hypothetical protein
MLKGGVSFRDMKAGLPMRDDAIPRGSPPDLPQEDVTDSTSPKQFTTAYWAIIS